MKEWCRTTIQNQEFVVVNPKEKFCFGPDLTLRKCRITFNCTRRDITFVDVKAYDCDFTFRRKFTGELGAFQSWPHCYLEHCRLHGYLQGHDFGRRSGQGWPEWAAVRTCDFTDAIIDGCRFFNTEITNVKLPGWPTFAVLNPRANAPAMRALLRRSSINPNWVEINAEEPEDVSLVVDRADGNLVRCAGDLNEFKQTLARFDFIRIFDPTPQ